MRNFKIGLAQIAPRLGDVDANLQKHLDYIAQAREQGVELLLFPELSLTGYSAAGPDAGGRPAGPRRRPGLRAAAGRRRRHGRGGGLRGAEQPLSLL